jgi:CBS domain-containing protein
MPRKQWQDIMSVIISERTEADMKKMKQEPSTKVTITARQIMNRDVVVVPENMGVRELANLLTEKMITGAPVVDAEGRLVGVVSSMDIVRYFSQENKDIRNSHNEHPEFYLRGWSDMIDTDEIGTFHVEEYSEPAWVSEIMTPTVFEVNEETPLTEIAAMMVRGRIHRVIVTNERRVVGIVSSLDVLRAVSEAAVA